MTEMREPAPPYDPHRSTSLVLTEVRTVLSRAETAIETIERNPTWILIDSDWDYGQSPPAYVPPVTQRHPDVDDMLAALRDAVAALERWRGPSKRRGPR
jgi:hypothetical protein